MEQYRIEQDKNVITVWNDTDGIGLRFKAGESLQRYTSSIVLNGYAPSTEEKVKHMDKVQAELTEFAAAKYPKEFARIK